MERVRNKFCLYQKPLSFTYNVFLDINWKLEKTEKN